MNNIKLITLAIIAIITTGAAVYLSTAEKSPITDPTKPKFLIGNIEPSIIDTIVIGTGDEAITIKRKGNKFVVTNKDNYPAKASEINELIAKCVDIQVTEMYTDNPDNHKDLGLIEQTAQTPGGIR